MGGVIWTTCSHVTSLSPRSPTMNAAVDCAVLGRQDGAGWVWPVLYCRHLVNPMWLESSRVIQVSSSSASASASASPSPSSSSSTTTTTTSTSMSTSTIFFSSRYMFKCEQDTNSWHPGFSIAIICFMYRGPPNRWLGWQLSHPIEWTHKCANSLGSWNHQFCFVFMRFTPYQTGPCDLMFFFWRANYFRIFFWSGLGIIFGFLLLCFFLLFLLFLLLCFSAFLLFCFSCFSPFLLFCFSASPASLLLCFSAFLLFCFFLFLCFSAFPAFPASLLFCFSCFFAFLLFCFCAFPVSLLLCFFASLLFVLLCLL